MWFALMERVLGPIANVSDPGILGGTKYLKIPQVSNYTLVVIGLVLQVTNCFLRFSYYILESILRLKFCSEPRSLRMNVRPRKLCCC